MGAALLSHAMHDDKVGKLILLVCSNKLDINSAKLISKRTKQAALTEKNYVSSAILKNYFLANEGFVATYNFTPDKIAFTNLS